MVRMVVGAAAARERHFVGRTKALLARRLCETGGAHSCRATGAMTSRLYKFVPESNVVSFLLRGIVKFTPIRELNDPSELVPTVNIDAVRESLAQLRQRGYTDDDLIHLRRQGALLQRLAPSRQAVQMPRTAREATALHPLFMS